MQLIQRFQFADEEIDKDGVSLVSSASLASVPDDLGSAEFEVLKTGEYYDPRYGKFAITQDILEKLKSNFDSQVLGTEVPLDVNHDPEHKAYAWVKELSVRSGSLWAKFKDFSTEGMRLLRECAYKYFSVDYAPINKVDQDGKKITINTVLRGIAMTNRPVIKGMQPTFLSEEVVRSNKSDNSSESSMKAVKAYAESLLKRGNITRAEADSMKLMFGTLAEEEKKAMQAECDQVETEAMAAEAKAKKAAEDKAKAEADAAAAGKTSDAQLAEAKKTIEDTSKRLSELEAEREERILSEAVGSLTLSEKNLTGFNATSGEKVKAFVKTLNADQRVQFSDLVKEVRSVTVAMLSEIGSGKAGGEASDEKKAEEAVKLAEERAKTSGRPKHVELAEIYKEKGLVK